MKLVCMIEILDPLLTAGLTTTAALAGWLASRRWHLRQIRNLQASHLKQSGVAAGHLAEARQTVALLKKEVADLQAQRLRAPAPVPRVEPSAHRSVREPLPHWELPGEETGFPDTQPW